MPVQFICIPNTYFKPAITLAITEPPLLALSTILLSNTAMNGETATAAALAAAASAANLCTKRCRSKPACCCCCWYCATVASGRR